eukprot:Gb_36123 [translate_table: standard]
MKKDGRVMVKTLEDQRQERLIHLGVGCDSCGLIPIIGRRFKCRDCHDRMGFDLCENCYKTGPILAGRFNQQHTGEHCFVEVPYERMYALFSNFVIQFPETGPTEILPADQQEVDDLMDIEPWLAFDDSTESQEFPDGNQIGSYDDDPDSLSVNDTQEI